VHRTEPTYRQHMSLSAERSDPLENRDSAVNSPRQKHNSLRKFDLGIAKQFPMTKPTTPVKLQKSESDDLHNPYSLPKLSPEA
jgi:hypothetical protein